MSDRSLLAHVLRYCSIPLHRLRAALTCGHRPCDGPHQSIDREGSHDFQQMSSVQAKSFGGGRTIALGSGEGAND